MGELHRNDVMADDEQTRVLEDALDDSPPLPERTAIYRKMLQGEKTPEEYIDYLKDNPDRRLIKVERRRGKKPPLELQQQTKLGRIVLRLTGRL